MFNSDFDQDDDKVYGISKSIENISLNSIRNILTDGMILQACDDSSYTFRHRILTPVVTVLHMILAAIWTEESFQASWDVMWSSVVSRNPCLAGKAPSRAALSKARQRLPLVLWNSLFDLISDSLQKLSTQFDSWNNHRIVLLDGTCISMPDTPDLMERFGTCKGYHGNGRYPISRIVTMCLANSMTLINYAVGTYKKSEISLTFSMLDKLKVGDLLIGDRHFAAAHYYYYYQARGLEYLTRAHQRLKISNVKRLLCYNENDFIGKVKINRKQRNEDSQLPKYVVVRFIRAPLRVRGKNKAIWFTTSLLDVNKYPASEVVGLYAKRWRVKTLIKQVKVGLSADVLRSMSADGVMKEIAARMIAINIVRTIIIEAAIQEEVRPIKISFTYAIRAIINFSPAFATEPFWKLKDIYIAMLKDIAAHQIPFRPGREEPRMLRREKRHYPSLRTTRAEWRKGNAA